MSRPSFLVPSDVSDSPVKRENCILFTQRLQYATFPLFSLQLTTHSTCTDAGGHKDTRTLRWMQTHTALTEGLEQPPPAPPPCLFSSAVTLLPWHVIKKCHRFWRSDFRRALPQNGQKGWREGGMRNDELVLDHACKVNPGGGPQSPFLWHDGSSQL